MFAQASVLEVYNDSVRDLLSKDKKAALLSLRLTQSGNVVIPNQVREAVGSVEDMRSLLARSQSARARGACTHGRCWPEAKLAYCLSLFSAAHDINEHSSRSHLVLTLHARIEYDSGKKTMSKLNLIDLAGRFYKE